MALPEQGKPQPAGLRWWALLERRRAARAAALAERYQAQAIEGPDRLRSVYDRLTEIHHQLHARHLAAAQLHEALADRIERSVGQQGRSNSPQLMGAVADMLAIRGTAAGLYSRDRGQLLVMASDPTAESAYQLEPTVGEGPAAVALASGAPVRAVGRELAERWERYGPAAHALGINAVCAIPLRLSSVRLGVLCCYATEPRLLPGIVPAADVIGDALTAMLMRAASNDSVRALMGP